jgi:hypothetical protein
MDVVGSQAGPHIKGISRCAWKILSSGQVCVEVLLIKGRFDKVKDGLVL